MKQLKAAFFDLDGTLIDTEPQYTAFWSGVGRDYHPGNPRFADSLKGTTLVDVLSKYFTPDQHAEVCRRLDEFESRMDFPIIEGAESLVNDLKSHGVECVVVTSSNRRKLQCVARRQAGLLSLFDRILTSEDFAASKPAPDCYLRAMQLTGAERDECVVFEDSFAGFGSAMSAGVACVGIATTLALDDIREQCSVALDSFVGVGYESVVEMLGAVSADGK